MEKTTLSQKEGSLQEVRALAAQDMQFFCALAAPEVVTIPFPDTYVSLWWLIAAQREGIYRFSWGLPRGYAKTALLKLLIAYLLIHRIRIFPLVVCATERLSKNFLFDLVTILESDNVRELYGEITWIHNTADYKLGHWNATGEPIIVQIASAMSAVRGLSVTILRPDIIIMDDMQTRENASSPTERITLRKWMFATLLKASDRNNALHLFIGNMYNKHCILQALKQSPEWTSFITGSILDDGTTIWPAFRSLDQIKSIHRADKSVGEEDIFWSEEQNIPVEDILMGMNLSGVEVEEYDESMRMGSYLIVDPSAGKVHSDNVAIAANLVCDNVPYMVDGCTERLNPGECIDKIIAYCTAWDIKCVGIESVAYQSTLGYHLLAKFGELGIDDIKIVELYPGKISKNKRIKAWIQTLQMGSYKIGSVDMLNLLTWELGFFDLVKTNNVDDLLDVGALGSLMYHKHMDEWLEPWRAKEYLLPVISDKDFHTNCSYTDA